METVKDNYYQLNTCPECGGSITENIGQVVCQQCGLVLDERIPDFAHSGRRAFTRDEKSGRENTGDPISKLIPNISLTTVFDKNHIKNPDLKRAAKWDTRISWEKRNLLIATTELKRIAGNLNLPEHVKEKAMGLYKEVFKKGLLKGRSINAMVAACLYFSLRINIIPKTLDDILEHTTVSGRDIRKSYVVLIRELNLKVPNRDPISLIPRYISALGLDSDFEILTVDLIQKYKSKVHISGKDPKGICAGAIYLAGRLKKETLTQKGIATAVGVTEVTLRSRFKELVKTLGIEV